MAYMLTFFSSIFKPQFYKKSLVKLGQKKILLFILILFVLVGVGLPQLTFAAWINWGCLGGIGGCLVGHFAGDAVVNAVTVEAGNIGLAIVKWILLIPVILTALLDLIAGTLLKWVIIISDSVLITRNQVVSLGWPIVRNFANIVIVAGFVGIAVATILRIREYEAKALLAKLIIAALLVNFSLVICGLVIDLSNIIVRFFLNNVGNNVNQFIDLRGFNEALALFDRNVTQGNIVIFVGTVIGNVFYNTMSAVTLFLYVFLFLFRIIALWILVILSPLALVCYVFPITKSAVFDKWWNNFIQWCSVGVFGAFFLFIGSQLMSIMNSSIIAPPSLANLPNDASPTIREIFRTLSPLFSFLVPGLFLVIGFIFSLQMSAMGSNAAIGAFKWAGGHVKAGGKWAGKWTANNTGLTRLKDRAIYGATIWGERLRLVNRGTADANWKTGTRAAEVDDKKRKERTDEMTTQQKLANLRSGAITTEGHLDNAAILKSMTKEEFDLLETQEQLDMMEKYRTYGAKTHEMAAKARTETQNRIISENRFDEKTRHEAGEALAGKGQLDSSLGALTQDQIQRLIRDAEQLGKDTSNLIKGLKGPDATRLIEANRAAGNNLFNPETRTKLLQAIFDKKQTDLMNQADLMDEMEAARINGMDLSKNVGQLSTENQLHILTNNLFNEEIQGKTVDALRKKKELHNIPEADRERVYRNAVEHGGVDVEDLTAVDHRAAGQDSARLQRLMVERGVAADTAAARVIIENARAGDAAAIATLAPIQDAASDEALNENIGSYNGDQLRDIEAEDLERDATIPDRRDDQAYQRIKKLTPDKIKQFQNAPQDRRDALRADVTELTAEMNEELELAANARLGFPPATTAAQRAASLGAPPPYPPPYDAALIDQAQATYHNGEAGKLRGVIAAINRLP